MEVRGSHTVCTLVTVSDHDVIESLSNTFETKVVPKDVSGGSYINSDGRWELWEDGHGSGYTTTQRAATVEEVALYEKFKQWKKLTYELSILK